MRLKWIVLCSTSLIVLGGAPARAQTAAPANAAPATAPATAAVDEGDAIVVTGIRESLQSAQRLKRNAPQIVDAVVAEDIGKLPDLAVSDTAARIPGVQVVRLGGEASSVLLRGLNEQFFNTLYNGREIFTAERRQVALQDFPSAGIAALEVFKTSTADLVEPGVIGLTNVRSRRPLDIDGFELAGNVFGLHTVQSGKVTPNGNLLISDRWNTGIGEIGALLNVSYTELQYLDSEPSNTDYTAGSNVPNTRLPDIQRLFYRSGNRVRPSANGSLQWKPTPELEFYIDGLYQGFRNKIDDTRADVPLYTSTLSNLVYRSGTDLLESGTATVGPGGPRLFSFRGGTYNKTDTYQFAVGTIYHAGPLKVTADLARTDSTFTGSTESVDRQFGINGYTANFDLTTPQFTLSGFNVSDPANYRFLGLFEQAQQAKGKDWQARIDVEYKFDNDFLNSIQVGGRYTTRDANRVFGDRYAGGFDVPITDIPLDYRLVKSGFKGTDVQSGFRTFLAPTYDSIRRNARALRAFIISQGRSEYTLDDVAPDPTQTYNASEETFAGYAQANYKFGDVIDGAVGLRAVQTDVSVKGTSRIQGAPAPVDVRQKFTDYLPNASLRWRFADRFQLRLSYTETRTKPNFQQLNPSTVVNPPDPNEKFRRGSGGNPTLTPIDSKNYDASLEYYFSPTGFVSATAFRRELKGYIFDQTDEFNDPEFGDVLITRPTNSRRGRIDGVEAQLSTFFDFAGLPTFFRRFGVQANYTYLDAATEFFNPVSRDYESGRILGVSKHTFNLVGLYESGPLSARVTYNKRSRFLDDRQFRGKYVDGKTFILDDLYLQEGNPPGRLDLSVNVDFTPKTTLFFDATNLTGEPFEYRFSSARAGAARAEYVRFLRYEEETFSVGLRFRL